MKVAETIFGNIELKNKVQTFIDGLRTDYTVLSECIDIEDIDIEDAYNSIYDLVQDNYGLNVEIIYYSSAIDFLIKNDPSLKDSLEIAEDFGYTLGNLNSEILASLLATQINEQQFCDLGTEIIQFFEEIQEEINEL